MPSTTPADNASDTDVITGHWPSGHVTLAGKPLDPARSLQIVNHSPTGFAWGYAGSGPAQLALAILLELGFTPDEAVAHHQRFKLDVIAILPRDGFTLSVADVKNWIERYRRM